MAKNRQLLDNSADGLVQPAHDPYWDAPVTRREAQGAINDLAVNDKNLAMQNDTTNIVVNFLCERLNITRAEIDAWVEKKKAEAMLPVMDKSTAPTANQESTSERTNG